ncbi:FMN-binding protein [Solemya pervernicosa gill symbiont]|uniref:Ion-translocating oxidoreductase complex subunit G n=1 Tax=Solemya pervernicosa gill symbiont TaxID=642797 RepID=A0A1T2KZH4_9GAMM|nr:FMN-binding protein [Solemya pervernicosa gill symbiont]OOZ38247.1 FMN-binding protein [Solemya pervernicosa gill symbiont]
MNGDQAIVEQQTDSGGKMIRTLGGIAMISGFLVVLVYQWTAPMIAENKRRAIEQAIFQVLPGAVSRKDFHLSESQLIAGEGDGVMIYAGFDAEGKLKGIAAEAAAQGYADVIQMLFGYDPACECITGIKILKSAETPGLGDKIFKDADFVANFNALEARLNSTATALANPITTVKHGTKSEPWQIDAISGATVSSVAIGKALDHSAQRLLPQLHIQWPTISGRREP